MLSAGTMRHHKVFVTKWDFSATPGVSLHDNTQHPESISTLNTDALLFQWDQQKWSCTLMRSGGLKTEKML